MFGKPQDREQPETPHRRLEDEAGATETVIARGTTVHGTIQGGTTVRVAGFLEGQIRIEGLVWIDKHGEVQGTKVEHWRCKRCEAIFGQMYLGDSYALVLPWMVEDASEVLPEQTQYFDFDCLGSKGIQRWHGWYDVISRRVVQVG